MFRLLLTEHIQNAYHSLKTTRTRTLLTTLGVAIGVASITVVLSLSGGISQIISGQVSALGGNIAVVRPGVTTHSANDFTNPTTEQTFSTSTITEDDYKDIQKIDGVEAAAPLMVINGSVRSTSNTPKESTVVATTPDLENITRFPIRDGQFIDDVTDKDTAIIGTQLSIDLFGTDSSIGQTFRIRGQEFTVIGILKTMNNPINYNNVDFDRTAIINLESGKAFHQGVAQIQQIDVRVKDKKNLTAVMKKVNEKLKKNHNGEKDFTVLSGNEIAKPATRFFFTITSIMTLIASVSLIVGGVGIMNIMLVGVAERTREIGLRKAVGASNRNIIGQFLIEALIISLLGGMLGYIGGYAIAFMISTFLTFSPAFTWQVVAIALATSVTTGTIFGIYPAIRASRKDPIESLRHVH